MEMEMLTLGTEGGDWAVSPAHRSKRGVVEDNVGLAFGLDLVQESEVRPRRHHAQGVWAPVTRRELDEVGVYCPQP